MPVSAATNTKLFTEAWLLLTLQQVPIRQSDSEQGVVVFPPLPLLLPLPHGFCAKHGVLLHQFSSGNNKQ